MEDLYKKVLSYISSFDNTIVRKTIDLCDDWRFSDSNDPFSHTYSYDDSGWSQVDLPHDYSIGQGFDIAEPSGINGGYVKTGMVWYRKTFDATGMDGNKIVKICFDGVASNSTVWINGHFLGQYPNPYSAFEYDIRPHLKFDAPNVIAVMCDTSLQPFSRFYIGTGIYRKVKLTVTDSLHFEPRGVFARVTKLNEAGAKIKIDADISVDAFTDDIRPVDARNENGERLMIEDVIGKCRIKYHVIDSDGNVVGTAVKKFDLPDFSKKSTKQSLTVKTPKLWSVDNPYMYRLHALLYKDNFLYDDIIIPLGIRTLDYDAENGFRINSDYIKLKGVCVHQDIHVYGGASTARGWAERIAMLKEMGANSVRCSHNPFPLEFYYVCDYMGMTVMDEAFDEWRRGWGRHLSKHGKNIYGYYLYYDEWWERDLASMITRARNCPSVIMWSLGNEIPELYFDDSERILNALHKETKRLDDSRPTIVCLEGGHNHPFNPKAMSITDIAGFNYVDSAYGIRKHDVLHADYPEYVICSSESMRMPSVWNIIRDRKFVIGQYLWNGFDYLGESVDFSNIPRVSNTLTIEFMDAVHKNYDGKPLLHGWPNGPIDFIHMKKPEFYLRKAMWTDEPVCKLGVKVGEYWRLLLPAVSRWNWDKGTTQQVYIITNCDTTELRLNGRVLGTYITNLNDLTPRIVNVEYEEGILELIGYQEGKQVCFDRLVTAGAPAKIGLSGDMVPSPDGFLHLYAEIQDADGNAVPYPDKCLTVTVSGSAKLYGMATCDLYDSTPYKSNSFVPYNGRCLIVIKVIDNGEIFIRFEYGEITKQIELKLK